MADWNDPTVNSNYVDFVGEVKDRDVDAALMFDGTGANLPNLTIRWNQTNSRFERLEGAAWEPRVLAVSGGGTGGATASAARTGLGLGSAAVQADNRYAHRSSNLSDLANATTARTNLGLGSAAVQADNRYNHRSNNLSDVANAGTARTNLGLGSAAVEADDRYNHRSSNLSDVANAATARSNLGANSASNLTTGTLPAARLPSQAAQIVTATVTLGGSFTGTNNLKCAKVGTVVTLTATNDLPHSVTSNPESAVGRLAAAYRPANNIAVTVAVTESFATRITVFPTGTIAFFHQNLDTGGGLNRTNIGVFANDCISISYIV